MLSSSGNELAAQRILERTANDNTIHIVGSSTATHLLKSLRENYFFELHLSTGEESLYNRKYTYCRKHTEVNTNGVQWLEYLQVRPVLNIFLFSPKLELMDLQTTGLYSNV